MLKRRQIVCQWSSRKRLRLARGPGPLRGSALALFPVKSHPIFPRYSVQKIHGHFALHALESTNLEAHDGHCILELFELVSRFRAWYKPDPSAALRLLLEPAGDHSLLDTFPRPIPSNPKQSPVRPSTNPTAPVHYDDVGDHGRLRAPGHQSDAAVRVVVRAGGVVCAGRVGMGTAPAALILQARVVSRVSRRRLTSAEVVPTTSPPLRRGYDCKCTIPIWTTNHRTDTRLPDIHGPLRSNALSRDASHFPRTAV
uniref:Uncharacterized protein n=1 Tax=Mycena chlorophos TaxID=658473 RepID=A0ABQ0LBL0_MYCCL|nr:predicted protein [Mycena chlorophos]